LITGTVLNEGQRYITLKNGLRVVLETVPHVESVAYNLLIPGGIISDHEDYQGASILLTELTTRGAGKLNSRQLSEAFENSGIRHGEGASHNRFSYSGSLLADELPRALELVASMVLEPHLPEEEIQSIKNSCIQDIEATKDNPTQRTLMRLCERYYPEPYNRKGEGEVEGIGRCDIDHLRSEWERRYCPSGSVLSIAGKIDPDSVEGIIRERFGDWEGEISPRPSFGTMPMATAEHVESDSAQMQIALATPSALFLDRFYYVARIVSGILSGGMFGRLFIEVREKRGLCYSVSARHSASRDYGALIVYAGTTPERAQETLDVLLKEIRIAPGTVKNEELERVKANILSSMIMGEESTASRAVSNGVDQWLLNRVRSLEEVKQAILNIELHDIDEYLEAFPVDSFMLQTLGSQPLDVRTIV
jgi:predicted Zn-dependent peptidase